MNTISTLLIEQPIPIYIKDKRKQVDTELAIIKSLDSKLSKIVKRNVSYFEAQPHCILPFLANASYEILNESGSQVLCCYKEILDKRKFKKQPTEEELSQFFYVIKREMVVAIYTHLLGVSILEFEFTMPAEDLKKAGIDVRRAFSDITIDCANFAFYHQNDAAAIQNIFNNQGVGLEFLCQHYNWVSEPLPGDLVVYERGLHFGIWDSKAVLSKWGQGPIVRHKVEETPFSYGETVQFLRKKECKLPFAKGILSYLNETQTFGMAHPLLRSPLTASGCREVFLQFLANYQETQTRTLFTQSFYGVRTIKPLFKAIKAATRAMQISDSINKPKLVKNFKEIVQRAANTLPINFALHEDS